MSAPRQHTVVIVGAGPTGIAGATLLAQYGIATLVLDRWDGVYPQPRAVHLDDEVFRIVNRLGIGAEFAGISRPALGLRLLDPQLKVLSEFRRDPAQSRNGYPQANMFDQPEFEALLRANLLRYPLVTLRGNAEVTDIDELSGGRSRITFTDRGDGSRHIVDTDYLLGCDGANSLVRRRIGAAMTDLRFEQRWLVIDVASSVDLEQWEGVHQVCNTRRAGTFMQIGDVRYRWEFRLLPGETADDYSTVSALRPLIAPWTAHADDSQLEIIRVAEYTFRAQIADIWRRGNTFLLGDAAHLTPPFVGQGMGAGLRDATNLSWKLAGVLNGTLSPSVLDTYQQERKPHARRLIDLALTVGRAMTSGGRFGDLVRRTVVPRLHLLPGMRDKVLDSTTPPLPRSALVHKTRAPRQLAGTLCPNTVIDSGQRLDSILGTGFAVVCAHPLTPGEQTAITDRGAVVHIAESGGELAAWMASGNARAALIRPDRTVMRAGRNVAEVCRALPTALP